MAAVERQIMSRVPAFLFAASLLGWSFAGQAMAAAGDGDKDIPRITALGGSCPGCELSGKKLTGAQIEGGNFNKATFIGCDLRGASITGSSFVGSDFTRADLRSASVEGANFTNALFH